MKPDLKTTAKQYFDSNPSDKDHVLAAFYAYHAPHFRVIPELPLHNFTSGARWSRCAWCERTREEVRHGDQDFRCGSRPVIREIADVLLDEARQFEALCIKAPAIVNKVVGKLGLSGSTLAILHHTHGIDPETAGTVIGLSTALMAEYEQAMEQERARSRASIVRTVITVRT